MAFCHGTRQFLEARTDRLHGGRGLVLGRLVLFREIPNANMSLHTDVSEFRCTVPRLWGAPFLR